MSMPDMGKSGVCRELSPHALAMLASLKKHVRQHTWTFGGGTELMLRIGHLQSKDIDLFGTDPQGSRVPQSKDERRSRADHDLLRGT